MIEFTIWGLEGFITGDVEEVGGRQKDQQREAVWRSSEGAAVAAGGQWAGSEEVDSAQARWGQRGRSERKCGHVFPQSRERGILKYM
jgi:hypothetical protein